MKAHILIVEDDAFTAKMLAFVLTDNGYHVSTIPDPDAVLPFLRDHPVNLVLLDVAFPRADGLALCVALQRAHPDLPVIFLSARASLADKVAGFSRGADDYLTKPFEPLELLVRIQAVLRRHRRAERNVFGMTIKVGTATLDMQEMRFVAPPRDPVALTPTEMKILECLMRNANAVLSRETLIERTWGYDYEGVDNRMNVYIGRLREKIEADPKEPAYIQTIRGLGYVFRDQSHAA
jgi:two-component system response regulator RegX3